MTRVRSGWRMLGRALISSRLRAVLSIGLLVGLLAVGTLAKWSDSATATSGVMSTGTIDIRADGVKAVTLTALAKTGMQRGDAVTQPVTISNVGGLPLTYEVWLQGTGNGVLLPYLRVAIAPRSGGVCGAAVAPGAITPQVALTSTGIAARTLAAAATDPLCVSVSLDSSAPASVGAQEARLVLEFRARSA